MKAIVKANKSIEGYTFDNVEFEKYHVTYEGKEIIHDTKEDFVSMEETHIEIKFGQYTEFHKVYECELEYKDIINSIRFIIIDGKAIRIPHYIDVDKLLIKYVFENIETIREMFSN
tara:strand:- start:440 stop:787 length:348 start_codon:yes stop_codon:yes gene_type:complete